MTKEKQGGNVSTTEREGKGRGLKVESEKLEMTWSERRRNSPTVRSKTGWRGQFWGDEGDDDLEIFGRWRWKYGVERLNANPIVEMTQTEKLGRRRNLAKKTFGDNDFLGSIRRDEDESDKGG